MKYQQNKCCEKACCIFVEFELSKIPHRKGGRQEGVPRERGASVNALIRVWPGDLIVVRKITVLNMQQMIVSSGT